MTHCGDPLNIDRIKKRRKLVSLAPKKLKTKFTELRNGQIFWSLLVAAGVALAALNEVHHSRKSFQPSPELVSQINQWEESQKIILPRGLSRLPAQKPETTTALTKSQDSR